MENIYNQIKVGLKDFSAKTGIKRYVIGLSGGLDSALVAVLAADAFGAGNVFAVGMPSQYTAEISNTSAAELAGNLGINFTVRPIQETFELLSKELKKDFAQGLSSLASQNLQSRIRGLILMAFANQLEAVVLACGNRSEIYTGYCTLYGDTVGALAPIGDIYKTEAFALAKWINRKGEVIPAAIINRAPSAELAPKQVDCDDLLPYDNLDIIIEEYAFKKSPLETVCAKAGVSRAEAQRMIKKIDCSAFKRCFLPPVIEVKR